MIGDAPGQSSSLRKELERRLSELKTRRTHCLADWKGARAMFGPHMGRFTGDREGGDRGGRYKHIIDATPLFARRTMSAGMLAGTSSPARPWFRLAARNDDLNKRPAVVRWLDDTTRVLRTIANNTNTYRALHTLFDELGTFGTGVNLVLPGKTQDKPLHNFPVSAGSYMLATDDQGSVNTMYREFTMSASQLVSRFGKERVSQTVRNLIDKGQRDARVNVVHAIEPRPDYKPGSPFATQMPWRSIYFEPGSEGDRILEESGHKRRRLLAPRWLVAIEDVYGTPPSYEVLGDARQLQHTHLRKGQGIDQAFNPAMQAPASFRDRLNRQPGGLTLVDQSGPSGGFKPLFDVRLPLQELGGEIYDIRQRINQGMYADLFRMILNDTRATPATAREIAEKHEEKMIMIGPVLERLHDELHSPLIDIMFDQALEAGLIPPPPPELEGEEITPRFVSVLAQAQQLVGLNSIDEWTIRVQGLAQIKPEIVDKVNADAVADALADMLGVDPDFVVTNDEVAIVRDQRARQQQAAQQAELAATAGKAARDLASANTGEQNALTDALQGYDVNSVI